MGNKKLKEERKWERKRTQIRTIKRWPPTWTSSASNHIATAIPCHTQSSWSLLLFCSTAGCKTLPNLLYE